MKKILEKIEWKTRKWNARFNLLELFLHDGDEVWGITFFTFIVNYSPYSLFSFEFRLPNKTNIKNFNVTSWDILFLKQFLYQRYEELSDIKLWSKLNYRWEKILYHILSKIFK
jgi:hypothetical protein